MISDVNNKIGKSLRFKKLLLNLCKSLNEAGYNFDLENICSYDVCNRSYYNYNNTNKEPAKELNDIDDLLPEKMMPIETLIKALKIVESYLVNNWPSLSDNSNNNNQENNLTKILNMSNIFYNSNERKRYPDEFFNFKYNLREIPDNINVYEAKNRSTKYLALYIKGLIHSFFVFPEDITPENLALFYLKGNYNVILAQQKFFSSSKIVLYNTNSSFSTFNNITQFYKEKDVREYDEKNEVILNDHIKTVSLDDIIEFFKNNKEIPIKYYLNNLRLKDDQKYKIYLFAVKDEVYKKDNTTKNFVVYANKEIIYTSRKLNAKDRKEILNFK